MTLLTAFVIEDDALIAMSLSDMLGDLGYTVYEAYTLDAVKLLLETQGLPSLTLCDGRLDEYLLVPTVLDVRALYEEVDGFDPDTFLVYSGSPEIVSDYLTVYPDGQQHVFAKPNQPRLEDYIRNVLMKRWDAQNSGQLMSDVYEA